MNESINIKKALVLSKALAVKAGLAIMEVYDTDFDIAYKGDESPLTFADTIANKIILSGLKEEFPDVAYLSEEAKDNKSRIKSKYCFIIDPLDGTKEFIKRNGEFTVNIALVEDGKPIMGVVFTPVLEELYFASVDEGAFFQTKGQKAQKISVTDKTQNLLLVGSKSHKSEQLDQLLEKHHDKIDDLVSCGSSLKGCMVARGQADIYYRFGYTCEWDTCAMQCVAECAGAIVMQMDKTPLTYNRHNTLNDKGFFIVNRKENIFV
jgi:3'(2'), 5'-bisphosphate nucleotidase